MQKQNRKLFVALLLGVMMSCLPSWALAADFTINIMRQDGTACSELWVNDKLVWRLALFSNAVKPVTGGFADANTTFIVPSIVHGMFVVKVE
ncbi:hypothetical protein [Sporomusa sphaeroides]|uniref:Uncharacterized protein n=2 Tax=Sporomusa TaxID=2375 RepID=A0ABP2CHJ0_9FIRM|nr:hypothetical protein [Sporomusa sphaeroides]OLS56896.1 hypothetical protein SPSPH_03920 [Sporomusa sphaeroides DSM 2875]CVK21728.1 hypothetical protein SSPH_04436 [Sporomusa sphaeroides DSM 2875]SCM81821.1 conserved exported hypothetical protein [uncultured Sporomusa sp.]